MRENFFQGFLPLLGVCVCVCVVTFLSSTYNTQTLQNNSIYPDLLPDEMDLLYSAYGDETGVQCALRLVNAVAALASLLELGFPSDHSWNQDAIIRKSWDFGEIYRNFATLRAVHI